MKQYAFVVNLVQDVSILRPVMRLAADRQDGALVLLVTSLFPKRDASGLWAGELQQIAREIDARVVGIKSAVEAHFELAGHYGFVFAGSESDLSAHQIVHDVLRCKPKGYVGVTLQHGLECVGFLHNRAHDAVHGDRVRFAADIVVGWFKADAYHSMACDQRSKLFVAGPPFMIEGMNETDDEAAPAAPLEGLICENLHSVRMSRSSRDTFLEALNEFCARMNAVGAMVQLRGHPGGRFTEKSKTTLPAGVVMNTAPFWKQSLGRFRYGISAPSSVLIDMINGAVPVAVWADPGAQVDLSNFAGLPVVKDVGSMWTFALDAFEEPDRYLPGQQVFMASLGIPDDIRSRYTALLASL